MTCMMTGCHLAAAMEWEALPSLPGIGVAGPLTGIHNGALIVAGGTNFPVKEGEDLWTASKVWHDEIHVLPLNSLPGEWKSGFRMDRPIAYSATVSTRFGVVCMGGEGEDEVFDDCFLLQWDGQGIRQIPLPSLPRPCAYGAAARVGDTVYLAGGQGEHSNKGLGSALHTFWALDLSKMEQGGSDFAWQELSPWPGPPRTLNLTIAIQENEKDYIYIISGRSGEQGPPGSDLLRDVYEYCLSTDTWQRKPDVPEAVYAGSGAAAGGGRLVILSGVDLASVLLSPEQIRNHPGFPRRAWVYDRAGACWSEAGPTPENQIVTPAVPHDGVIYMVSGEIGPRVRSRNAWRVRFQSDSDLRETCAPGSAIQ